MYYEALDGFIFYKFPSGNQFRGIAYERHRAAPESNMTPVAAAAYFDNQPLVEIALATLIDDWIAERARKYPQDKA
ncbi:hypothetical protein R1flu_018595 [Riccia fluitans]|uniref:Uncharacterized protein n=1 Tax=Riccia fluitans TaxID=41844 RepID=A0ABD1ZHC6_9MARC